LWPRIKSYDYAQLRTLGGETASEVLEDVKNDKKLILAVKGFNSLFNIYHHLGNEDQIMPAIED